MDQRYSHQSSSAEQFPFLAPQGSQRSWNSVPSQFQDRILLHVVKNGLTSLNSMGQGQALILAIQGPRGMGKSFQTRAVCSGWGIYLVPLSGAMLSGSFEGAPVAWLERAYKFASTLATRTKSLTALLVDDFDLSVASTFDDRRYTVNTQLLTAFLMNLADDPTVCGNEQTRRIPILITGNNFTALHSPLTRPGRVDFFDWNPSMEDKLHVVKSIFQSMLDNAQMDKLQLLLAEHEEQPLSFFASLKSDLLNQTILDKIRQDRKLDLHAIERLTADTLKKVTVDELRQMARQRAEAVAQAYS